MLNMRIKFDVWSTGLNERLRNDIRENIQRIFSQLPVRRVWYYLKQVRNMALLDRSVEGSVIFDGPEDIIAGGNTLLCEIFTGYSEANVYQFSEPSDPQRGNSSPYVRYCPQSNIPRKSSRL